MPRNNILLRKFAMPKRVQLPNGRVIYAKYQKFARNVLLERVKVGITNVRKIGPRRQRKQRNEAGRGMPTQVLISTAIALETKVAKSNIGKTIIKYAIDYIPTTYQKLNSKIKIKTFFLK